MNKKILLFPLIMLFSLSLFSCSQNNKSDSLNSSSFENNSTINSSEEKLISKLDKPSLSFEDGLITWNNDELASMYQISINDELSFVSTNSYLLSEYGNYNIKVRSIALDFDKYENSDWSDVSSIEYKEKIYGNVILACSSITMIMDDYYNLQASVFPKNENITISYESSDESIAYCDSTGFIVANDIGEVTITAKAKGYVQAKCFVKVNPSLSLDIGKSITLDEGDSIDLGITCKPSLKDDDIITFKCSDPTIAFVGDTGMLTGIKEGTCSVEVLCTNGTSTSINVTVNKLLPSIITFNITLSSSSFGNLGGEPESYEVYLVGSFNNWTTCDNEYKMSKTGDRTFTLTTANFTPKTSISYKYIIKTSTGYAWEAFNGDNLANRSYNVLPGTHAVSDTVSIWQAISE